MSLNYDIMLLLGEVVKAKRVFARVMKDIEWADVKLMTRNTEDNDNFGGQEGGRWWEVEYHDNYCDPRSCYLARTIMNIYLTPDHLTNYSYQVEAVESWNLITSNGTGDREDDTLDHITLMTGGNWHICETSTFSAWGTYCP